MLRYKTETRPGLVALYTTSGQETERVYSYNAGARTRGPRLPAQRSGVMDSDYWILLY